MNANAQDLVQAGAARAGRWYRAYTAWRNRCDPILRVLSICSLVLLVNALYGAVLLVPQQSAEALRVLAEDTRFGLYRLFLMWALSVLLGLVAWWSARLTLSSLHPDARWWPGPAGRLARNLPRLAGSMPVITLGFAISCITAGGEDDARSANPWFAALTLTPIFAWLVVRRWNSTQHAFRIVGAFGLVAVVAMAALQTIRSQSALTAVLGLCSFSAPAFFIWTVRRTRNRKPGEPDPPLQRGYVVAGVLMPIAVSITAFILFTWAPTLPSYLGTGSIVLVAALTWLPLLAVLHWASFKLRLSLLAALGLLAVALSWLDWNDNHAIRPFRGVVSPSIKPAEFKASFIDWLKHRERPKGGGPVPVILVATEGGGIYAAYYTARALSLMQDMDPTFADQVFAISGVSGGSVGASVFCALVDHHLQHPKESFPGWYTQTADKVLREDFLSPLLASALLEDMLQQFFAPPLARWDRARSLEAALERAWRNALNSGTFEEPFDGLWARAPRGVPSLVLNTTEVDSGQRVVVSNLVFSAGQSPALASLRAMDGRLVPCLSTAACLSARFPIVTPAASLRSPADALHPGKHRLVDGGYFENTGVATAMEMFYAMRSIVKNEPGLPPCRFVLIRIGSQEGKPRPPFEGLGELLSPFRAMIHTREARGQDAIRQLQQMTEEYDPKRDWKAGDRPERIEFVLDTNRGYPIPLGWLLSEEARAEIAAQLPSVQEVWAHSQTPTATASAEPTSPPAGGGASGAGAGPGKHLEIPADQVLRSTKAVTAPTDGFEAKYAQRKPSLVQNRVAAEKVERLLRKGD